MWQGSGGYVQNFKSIRKKLKIFILGCHFLGGVGCGELDCSQYQTLTHPRSGLKNLCTNFGNDWSHRLGGVDDRQTENLNPCYAL